MSSKSFQNASKLNGIVSVLQFGAVGDGTTNDTAAVLAALQSGFVVDGGGLTYAVSGTVQPSSFKGLRNANFVQLAPSTASVATLYIYALSDWFIDNCKFDMGSVTNTGSSDDSSKSALRVRNADGSYCENFRILGVTVTGDGNGSRIQVRQSKRFTITECLVHDCVAGFTPDPTNDIMNGFDISDCANFTVSNCNVYNLKSIVSGTPINRHTRGFLFTEVRDCTITGCNSTLNDQCFDFSGAVEGSTPAYYEGNRRFTLIGCTANNGGTFGFKFANVTREAIVSGCIANNCGNFGFVFSPSAVSGITAKYNTQNIDVVGCKVVNVLGVGGSGINAEGFRVMSNVNFPSYPRGIRMVDCSVSDTQNTPTTLYGFVSDAAPVTQPTSGYNSNIANYAINCSVGPGVTTAYNDIGSNLCSITSSSNQTINDSTWTSVDFPVNLKDETGLHSTSSNVDTIIIKVPGLYSVASRIEFAANATGTRRVRIMVNGAESTRTQVIQPAASTVVSVGTEKLIQLATGDAIRIEAFQDSGSSLQLNLSVSIFEVCKTS
jgi:hypothetical protein